jgi:hypothetical protein
MEHEGQPPVSTTTLSSSFQICFPWFFSLFSAIGKEAEEWWDIVREDVGCVGVTMLAL